MTIVALIFTPLVLVYQGWSYWVFRARVRRPGDPLELTADLPLTGGPSDGNGADGDGRTDGNGAATEPLATVDEGGTP